jgi:hypothetical protein
LTDVGEDAAREDRDREYIRGRSHLRPP